MPPTFTVAFNGKELFSSSNRMECWRYAYAKARDLGLAFNYEHDAWVGSAGRITLTAAKENG